MLSSAALFKSLFIKKLFTCLLDSRREYPMNYVNCLAYQSFAEKKTIPK